MNTKSEKKNKKRCRLAIDLGEHHEAFLELAKKYDVKPATLAAIIIKQVISDEVQNGDKRIACLIPAATNNTSHQHLRLRADELKILDEYASIMGQTRHQALVGLVRAITVNEPQFTIGEIEQLDRSNYELHKIGVNLNQIAHRTNTVDFKNFGPQQASIIMELINSLIDRTDGCLRMIEKHIDSVWKLVNSARFRTELKQKLRH